MSNIVAACKLPSSNRIFIVSSPIEIAYTDDDLCDFVTWTLIDIGDEDELVQNNDCLLVFDEHILFVGTSKGRIYRSEDYGESWHIVEDGVISRVSCSLLTRIDNNVLVGFSNGITAISCDKGNTWKVNPPLSWLKGDILDDYISS